MKMNKFESVIVLKPETEKEKILAITEEVEKTVDNLINYENLGIRKFAYEIEKYKEGIYLVFHFKSGSKRRKELEEYYKTEKNILKFIIVKEEE
jgi:small subunit ribosomal protein S6